MDICSIESNLIEKSDHYITFECNGFCEFEFYWTQSQIIDYQSFINNGIYRWMVQTG